MYLTGCKQDAVMRGGTSNTFVHPFFIPVTAGLGVRFHAGVGHPHTAVRLHAKYVQLGFEQLAEIDKGFDPSLKVHAFLYVTTSSLHGRWFNLFRVYFMKACIVLDAAELRFIPETGRPSGLTEDVHERLAMLTQVIYFEHYLFLAVDGLEPKMTAWIEEFRHELQVRIHSLAPRDVDRRGRRKPTHTCLRSVR